MVRDEVAWERKEENVLKKGGGSPPLNKGKRKNHLIVLKERGSYSTTFGGKNGTRCVWEKKGGEKKDSHICFDRQS